MAKNIPLEVVLECLATREYRVAIDLVRDEVETELHKVNSAMLLPFQCIQMYTLHYL